MSLLSGSSGAGGAGGPGGAGRFGIPAGTNRTSAPAAPRGFWLMRDIPTALWLLLTVVAALTQEVLPAPRWLVIHLLLLGAITHAILVWSQYFSFALLRSRATLGDRKTQNLRLILANSGAALVFVGVPSGVWALTLVGCALLVTAVGWHGWSLVARLRGSLPGRFGKTTRYYIAASALLVVGVTLGAILARVSPANLVLSHILLNLLGWVGLTVAGTVVTLWPTILRTRADEHAATGAARALPMLAIGVLIAAGGAALAWVPLVALGLALYVAGLIMIGVSLFRAARRAAPHSFSALSVGLALMWWIGIVAALCIGTIIASVLDTEFVDVVVLVRSVTPFLAAGFAAQVLVGALSYLIPVVLGGGPTPVRAGTRAFDRFGPARIAVANTALAVLALPITGAVRIAASILYIVAMASFLVIMMSAMRTQRVAKRAAAPLAEPRRGPIVPEGERPAGFRAGQAIAGLITVVLVVVICTAIETALVG